MNIVNTYLIFTFNIVVWHIFLKHLFYLTQFNLTHLNLCNSADKADCYIYVKCYRQLTRFWNYNGKCLIFQISDEGTTTQKMDEVVSHDIFI